MAAEIVDKCLPLAVLFQLGDIQFLALRSSYRLNAQVEFADNKPVICPTNCTTHSLCNKPVISPTVCTTHCLCHSDILSVLLSHYVIVNEIPVFGARVHPSCLSASW